MAADKSPLPPFAKGGLGGISGLFAARLMLATFSVGSCGKSIDCLKKFY